MMAAVAGDALDPAVEEQYLEVVRRHDPGAKPPARVDRFAFYERARVAFAVVMTGETRKYGNLLLKKGVTDDQGVLRPMTDDNTPAPTSPPIAPRSSRPASRCPSSWSPPASRCGASPTTSPTPW